MKAIALQQMTQTRRAASALALLAAKLIALLQAVPMMKRSVSTMGKPVAAMFVASGISTKCRQSHTISSKFFESNWEYRNTIRGIRSQVATG